MANNSKLNNLEIALQEAEEIFYHLGNGPLDDNHRKIRDYNPAFQLSKQISALQKASTERGIGIPESMPYMTIIGYGGIVRGSVDDLLNEKFDFRGLEDDEIVRDDIKKTYLPTYKRDAEDGIELMRTELISYLQKKGYDNFESIPTEFSLLQNETVLDDSWNKFRDAITRVESQGILISEKDLEDVYVAGNHYIDHAGLLLDTINK